MSDTKAEPTNNTDDVVRILRETNRRLNRRVQKIEGSKLYQEAWSSGWHSGMDTAAERCRKEYEKRLAEYKKSTRLKMDKIRKRCKAAERMRPVVDAAMLDYAEDYLRGGRTVDAIEDYISDQNIIDIDKSLNG